MQYRNYNGLVMLRRRWLVYKAQWRTAPTAADHTTHLHGGGGLLLELEQLLVALLNLLVERLVLDLELLKIDEVQPLRQLLLLPQRVLNAPQLVAEVDVLEPHALHLLLLGGVCTHNQGQEARAHTVGAHISTAQVQSFPNSRSPCSFRYAVLLTPKGPQTANPPSASSCASSLSLMGLLVLLCSALLATSSRKCL